MLGHRVDEVLDGAPPAIGDLQFMTKVIVAEQNAPLPDLFGSWPVERIDFHVPGH